MSPIGTVTGPTPRRRYTGAGPRAARAACVADSSHAGVAEAAQLRRLAGSDDVLDRRAVELVTDGAEKWAQVYAIGYQGGGAMVQLSQLASVRYPVVPVHPEGPPSRVRQEADVASTGLQGWAAPGPPWARLAFGGPDRDDQQGDGLVSPVRLGHGQDVEAEVELEVVDLHGRTALLLTGGGRRQPHGGVEVVPDNFPLYPDDPPKTWPRRSKACRLEQSLVVGQLQHVSAPLASPAARALPGSFWASVGKSRARCLDAA